jgi:hypothetical protein
VRNSDLLYAVCVKDNRLRLKQATTPKLEIYDRLTKAELVNCCLKSKAHSRSRAICIDLLLNRLARVSYLFHQ